MSKKIEYVILNEGHGSVLVNGKVVTPGKRSPDGKFIEGEHNRTFSSKLAHELGKYFKVQRLMGTSPINASLKNRVKTANMFDKDTSVYIGIHTNAATNTWNKASGHTVFYFKFSKESKKLAQRVSDWLGQSSTLPNRGIKPTLKLTMLRKTKMPGILVERYFHTSEYDLDIGPIEEPRMAHAISMGVHDYNLTRGSK